MAVMIEHNRRLIVTEDTGITTAVHRNRHTVA